MKENRTRFQIYCDATYRLLLWHVLSKRILKLVLVTEFPKSGGTWFCQMLSDASGLPFPRNEFPNLKRSIMHGHHLFQSNMGDTIAIIRDGRDVMVSSYFYFLFENDRNLSSDVAFHRKKLNFTDYNNIVENMPRFIKYMFEEFSRKSFSHFSWSEHIKNVLEFSNSKRVLMIFYEDLLSSPKNELIKSLKFYQIQIPSDSILEEIVAKYSFKNLTKRDQGSENRASFLRKGIRGDWKNYFSEEACKVFKKYAGRELIKMGYERDMSWGSHLLT